MFLERGTENLDAEVFQYGLEKVPRSGWRVPTGIFEQPWKDQDQEDRRQQRHEHLVGEDEPVSEMKPDVGNDVFGGVGAGEQKVEHGANLLTDPRDGFRNCRPARQSRLAMGGDSRERS